jgi:hypothetical protein
VVPEAILQDRETFLGHFATEQKSAAANLILKAVRAGCDNPHQVVGYVIATAERRLRLGWGAELAQAVLELDRETLLAGARWALWWESLPYAEKQRLKAERSTPAIERYMAEQPPTEKQLSYLQALGYSGPAPANRLEASRLIDEAVKGGRHAR